MSTRFSVKSVILVAVLLCAIGAALVYWQQGRQLDKSEVIDSMPNAESMPVEKRPADREEGAPSETPPAREREAEVSDDRPAPSEQPSEAELEVATEAWLAAYACRDGCENELGGLAEEPTSLEEAQWLYRAGHPTVEERAYWTGSDAGLYDAMEAARRGNVRAMNTLASHYLEQGDIEAAMSQARAAAQHCSPLGSRLQAQAFIEMGRIGDSSAALIALRRAYLLGDTTVAPLFYELAGAIGYDLSMLAGPDETALRGMSVYMQRNERCRHPGFRPLDLG